MSIQDEVKKLERLREQMYDQEKAVKLAILETLKEELGLIFTPNEDSCHDEMDDVVSYVAEAENGLVYVDFGLDGDLYDYDDQTEDEFFGEKIRKIFNM